MKRDQRTPEGYAKPPAAELSGDLERMRYRGYAGGFITRHRALLFSPNNPAKMVPAFLLSLAFLLGWWLLRDVVCRFWSFTIDFWQTALGLGGAMTKVEYWLFDVIPFSIPYLNVGAGYPSSFHWWLGMILTALLVLVSLLLPRRYLPLAYGLRIVAFFQATAQLFFYFWGEYFPYEAAGYIHGMLIASWFLVAIVPLILGFTYFVFDFKLGRKILFALVMMGYQTVLVPMQYVLHAYIMYHGSLLFLPLVFLTLSLPLNVVTFIALFGWGFTWEDRLFDEAVQWKIRRRAY